MPATAAPATFSSLRPAPAGRAVEILDQTRLPFAKAWIPLAHRDDAAHAIAAMQTRGAPLIGAVAAFGLALAMAEDASDANLAASTALLAATRPTAVNLAWALARLEALLRPLPPAARAEAAWVEAWAIAHEDAAQCAAIGAHGAARLLGEISEIGAPAGNPIGTRTLAQAGIGTATPRPLNIMTHCNAGWLATVDHGTALAPIYRLHADGVPVHVWVSETRPRNQGLLTAWELAERGVPHTLIADNAAGLLMMQGRVDAVIVGADRIAANGDVANKVGTYLKALAAGAHGVPFFVAAPVSTLDFACPAGSAIPIEERAGDELRQVPGRDDADRPATVRQLPAERPVANPAFDVTPAALVTALITERGTCPASGVGLAALYPERAGALPR